MKLLTYALVVPAFLWLLIRGMEIPLTNIFPHHYTFHHAELQQIVQDALANLDIDASAETVMDSVYVKLKERYPKYIADVSKDDWVFNNAGNAMGSMVILHASLTEYLIFFGTPIGTEGHTGTHFADDYFTILYGEQNAALPSASTPERYFPGDQHHLPYGVNKQYRMVPGSYALELAQGYIPTMLPFGFIEAFTTTFDVTALYKTVYLTAHQIIYNMLQGKF